MPGGGGPHHITINIWYKEGCETYKKIVGFLSTAPSTSSAEAGTTSHDSNCNTPHSRKDSLSLASVSCDHDGRHGGGSSDHVLNLVIASACSERVIRNMNGSVMQAA